MCLHLWFCPLEKLGLLLLLLLVHVCVLCECECGVCCVHVVLHVLYVVCAYLLCVHVCCVCVLWMGGGGCSFCTADQNSAYCTPLRLKKMRILIFYIKL